MVGTNPEGGLLQQGSSVSLGGEGAVKLVGSGWDWMGGFKLGPTQVNFRAKAILD